MEAWLDPERWEAMDKKDYGLAEGLFDEFVRGLLRLADRTAETEMEMEALTKQFAIRIPHCPLALYAKVEPPRWGRGRDSRPNPRFTGGRPRGLYWGRVTRTHIVIHLFGRLNGGMIWKIGLRGSKAPLFWAFERERVRLNRTHTRLTKAREDLRKALLAFGPGPLNATTIDLPRPFAARDLPLVRGLRALAEEWARLPAEAEGLVREYRARVVAFPKVSVKLVFWEVDRRMGNRRLYFAVGRSHRPAGRLRMRELRRFKLDPGGRAWLRSMKRRAVALNRAMSCVRRRVRRVREILARAARPVRIRRRPPRAREEATG